MKFLSYILLASSLAITAAGPASAGVVQFNGVSTITSGTDELGLFGAPSSYLLDKSFSLTISFDTDLNTWFANGSASFGHAPGTIKAVVGGVEFSTVTLVAAENQYASASAMNNSGSGSDYNWADQFGVGVGGSNANGLVVSAGLSVQSTDPEYVTAQTTLTNLRGLASPSGLWLDLKVTDANGLVTSISSELAAGSFSGSQVVEANNGEVPEPASLALLAAGLTGMAWRRRATRR